MNMNDDLRFISRDQISAQNRRAVSVRNCREDSMGFRRIRDCMRGLIISATALAILSLPAFARQEQVSEQERYVSTCDVPGRDVLCANSGVGTSDLLSGTGILVGIGALALVGIATGIASDANEALKVTPEPPTANPPLVLPSNPSWWRTPEFNRQHGLGMIGVEHRYAAGATGKDTLGAIYDSGIDLEHPDVERIRIDLSHGYGTDPDDISDNEIGHGTHVYGIMGAARNEVGIHGIAPNAEFMILNHAGDRLAKFEDGLKRAADAGADVMNNSWAWSQTIDDVTHEVIMTDFGPDLIARLRAMADAGVNIVFGTGNAGIEDAYLTAALPVVFPELENIWIAVTALDTTDDLRFAELWSKANHCGSAMDWCLAAPGQDIKSLLVGGGTRNLSGTSLSAPHVSGAILVLKSQFPEMTASDIRQILFDTAVDLGAPGVDSVFGHGALNLNEAMAPQGALMVELGAQVDETTAALSDSWITESAITSGTLAAAMSGRDVLVTDSHDRGYFTDLGFRVMADSLSESSGIQAGMTAAFARANNPYSDLRDAGFDLRFDAFGAGHDVTRIAHMDPFMALVSRTEGTGFSMDVPVGKTTVSMAQVTAGEANALSVAASLPFGEWHDIGISLGRTRETDGILGARAHGAFAGLNSETVYGRVRADFALGEKVVLNGSITAGRTSFRGGGLIAAGLADTRAAALGLTFNDALVRGDRLSIAVAQPLVVSDGRMTLRGGTGISASVDGRRTDHISYQETTVPLGGATRAPELHLGYLHSFGTRKWDSANLAFGGIVRRDGGMQVMDARVELTLGF